MTFWTYQVFLEVLKFFAGLEPMAAAGYYKLARDSLLQKTMMTIICETTTLVLEFIL